MLNKAQIIGRIGRDPETRYTSNGEAVTNFSVATSKKWKDKNSGELVEETEWHRVSMFGRLAEIANEHLKKGALVYIEGEIKTRKYQDRDGVERTSTEIRAHEMRMLGGKNDQHHEGGEQPAAPRQQRQAAQPKQPAAAGGSGFDDMDDDIPF